MYFKLACAEIGHLAELNLSWRETQKGRQVPSVASRFTSRDASIALAAADEHERRSTGRQARRGGTADTIVDPAAVAGVIHGTTARLTNYLTWPADDAVSAYAGNGELYRLAVEHDGEHAVDRIATSYKKHIGDKRLELIGDPLRPSWRGFCEAKAKQWIMV